MNNYEGVFIIDPDLSPDATKGAVGQIDGLIQKHGGRIDGVQEWGKKRLAYKIKKKQDGHYVFFNFQLSPSETKKLESAFRLNDHLIRFLLVNKENI